MTIIGGGASGVLLAAHLLRDPETDIRVTLLERRGQFGRPGHRRTRRVGP